MATKKHGGKRPNSGRKPVNDKREAVFIYVKSSLVKKLGKGKVKAIAEAAVECA